MTNAQLHGCAFEGWQCFHCGDVFTTVGAAQDHFGHTPDKTPSCKIKVGDERGLEMELRKAEKRVDELTADLAALRVNIRSKFEFEMRAVPKDPTGYYLPKWDKASKISVIAETKEEAISIASVMLGKSPRGWPWVFIFDRMRHKAGAA